MSPSRSPESSLENTFRDGSPDKIASQTMSREANAFVGKYNFLSPDQIKVSEKLEPVGEKAGSKIAAEMTNRDKVSFVSAAFCNPLFLVGMGAAMAVLDDLREAREARMEEALSGNLSGDAINSVRRQADSDRQEQAAELKAETEEQKKKRRLLEATGLIGSSEKAVLGASFGIAEKSILKDGLRKQQQKKEMRGKMREKLLSGLDKGWDEKAAQRSVMSWLKANKLAKHKVKLENQIEKSRGKESLSFVSSLASKLEEVDKALKRIGA